MTAGGWPELLRRLRSEVELPVGGAGMSLGAFYGLGDWASIPRGSQIEAGQQALGELRAAAAVLDELQQRVARELVGAQDAVLAGYETVCGAGWGVCPEHGNTLRSSGGRTWCTAGGCGRSWNGDRLGRHCAELAAVIAADGDGQRTRLCVGHWRDAQERLVGARMVQRLPQAGVCPGFCQKRQAGVVSSSTVDGVA